MDKSKKDKIEAKLAEKGHSTIGLTETRWAQLEALFDAAEEIQKKREEAIKTLKTCKITPHYIESLLKERYDYTITDQTIHNNRLLKDLLSTYKDYYVEKSDLLKRDNEEYKRRFELMYKRDAECEILRKENYNLEQKIKNLRADLKNAQDRILQLQSAKKEKKAMITAIEIAPKSDSGEAS